MDNMNTAAVVPWTFQGSNVRTVMLNGEPWWVAKDVAEILEYSWSGSSRVEHVPAEWRGVTSVVTPSGIQEMIVLSEQGLYFFLNRSDKPKALSVQKWIAGEVMPQIRKTGSYSLKPAITIPEDKDDQILFLCSNLTEKIHECKKLKAQIEEQLPKVALAEACVVSTGLQTLTETAKVLKVHPNLFIKYLKQIGVLYKEDSNNLPMDKYAKNGYFEVKEFVFNGKSGEIHKRLCTYVTGKGLEFLKKIVDALPANSKIRSEYTRRNEVTL